RRSAPPNPGVVAGQGSGKAHGYRDRAAPRERAGPESASCDMLPAEIAQAVKRIQFVTGRQVSDVMAGAYLSVFKGRGMEFDEVRPYVPGDDVRSIDWNVTARTGEPHVKRFVEERELTVMLLVDVSASQDFGSGRRSKLEGAVGPSALLAMSARATGDRGGLRLLQGGAAPYNPP